MKKLPILVFLFTVFFQFVLHGQSAVDTTGFNVCFASRFDTMDTRYNFFKRNYDLAVFRNYKPSVNVYLTLAERERLRKLFFESQMHKIPNHFSPVALNSDFYDCSHGSVTYTFCYNGKNKTIQCPRKEVKLVNPKMAEIIDKIRHFDSLFCSILYANDSVRLLPRTFTLDGDIRLEPLDFKPNNDSIKPAVSFGEYMTRFEPFKETNNETMPKQGVLFDRLGNYSKTFLKYIESLKECNCQTTYVDNSKKNKKQLYNLAKYDMYRAYEAKNFYFVSMIKSCFEPTPNIDRYSSMLLITYSKTGRIMSKVYAGKEDFYNHCTYSVALNPLSITVRQASIHAGTPYEGDSIPCTVTNTRFTADKQGRIIRSVLSKQKGSLSMDKNGYYVLKM